MKYYIVHDTMAMYWNGETWVTEITEAWLFEDYDTALKECVIKDLSNYTIKQWH